MVVLVSNLAASMQRCRLLVRAFLPDIYRSEVLTEGARQALASFDRVLKMRVTKVGRVRIEAAGSTGHAASFGSESDSSRVLVRRCLQLGCQSQGSARSRRLGVPLGKQWEVNLAADVLGSSAPAASYLDGCDWLRASEEATKARRRLALMVGSVVTSLLDKRVIALAACQGGWGAPTSMLTGIYLVLLAFAV